MGAIRRVYDLLLETTGIEVPEVEEILASHSWAALVLTPATFNAEKQVISGSGHHTCQFVCASV